jgi:putative flippase GtrA
VSTRSSSERSLVAQLASFALIGLLTNGALYGFYLWLTYVGSTPLAAMSVAYVTGVALSFILNGRITFAGRSSGRQALVRFVVAYGFGYVFNAAGLVLAISGLGVPHYWAQLFMIGATAVFLFILQRWWVFRTPSANALASSSHQS